MFVEAFDIVVVQLLDLGCNWIIERSFWLVDRSDISSFDPLLYVLLYSVNCYYINESKPFDLAFLDDRDGVFLNPYAVAVEIVVRTVGKRFI